MRKIILLAIIALAVSFSAVAQTKTAEAKKEMTVKEYFLAIPTEFIKAEASKRTAWINSDDASIGYLSFNIPIAEITGEKGEGSVWGALQVFKKKDGGILLGMANNLCAENECLGLIRFLEYKAGKFTDVSDDYLIIPDNDEVIKILKNAPAFTKKNKLKDGVQVPLALEFNGNDKSILFIAGCETDADGGVVAKEYKWNGEAFVEFEREESPE